MGRYRIVLSRRELCEKGKPNEKLNQCDIGA
jgi:hypothetical protein